MRKSIHKSSNSYRITVPKLETMQTNTTYSFTINIKHSKIQILSSAVKAYNRKLNNLFDPYAEYKLYPELSPCGRLHYHGYISFNDKINLFNFYYSLQNILDISIEIDTIADTDVWNEYVIKQSGYRFIFEDIWNLPYVLTNST